ncbi:MAG TPA: tyrosine-type recombinase/integrase [Gemmatimonadaceae bacterium]|nr:tyrosine-type recombinase/integrase [Gemmatimonadaceae bacterium]
MRLQLYQRGHIWWCRGSDGGVKFRKSTKEVSEGKAKQVRDRWERELRDPAGYRANKATVASAAERWMREITATMNPETVRFYKYKICHVTRLLGATKLASVTHDKVLKFIETREAEGADSHSLHRELTTLRLTLKSAKRAREFTGDPRDTIPKYKAGYTPLTDWVTAEQVWAAIAHLLPHRGAAVAFAIATAADFSSIFTAKREDVSEAFVLVRGTKTGGRRRHVPRIDVMAPFLRHALAYATGDGSVTMFSEWGSMPRDLRLACRHAGVPEFTARTLRRSAATWMVQAGVPYEVAAKFLGHGSTSMLIRVYGQLAPADAARLINEKMVKT